jgi:hypothetical protein
MVGPGRHGERGAAGNVAARRGGVRQARLGASRKGMAGLGLART